MTHLLINGHTYHPQLVVFDKDGTLVDFQQLWGQRSAAALAAATQALGGTPAAAQALRDGLGLTTDGQVVAESVLAVGTMDELYTAVRHAIINLGRPADTAESILRDTILPHYLAPIQSHEIQPRGPVKQLLQTLRHANIHVAVLTSDNRQPTLESLDHLGITDLVEAVVAGDNHWRPKPHPDGLLHLASLWDIPLPNVIMVGDSGHDMATGRAAGVGACIGLTGGAGSAQRLAHEADQLIPDLSHITLT